MDYPETKNADSLIYNDEVIKSFKTVEILKSHVLYFYYLQ